MGAASYNFGAHVQNNMNYFALQMSYSDRLRLILAPDEIIRCTEIALRNTKWRISSVKRDAGYTEFKLSGRPWLTSGLSIKYFMCSLLQGYYAYGWHLKSSMDLQRNGSDTSQLFLKKHTISTTVACLSLNSFDILTVLGPQEVIQIVKKVILNTWPYGTKNMQANGQAYEFRIGGNPWSDSMWNSAGHHQAPSLICEILSAMFKRGWLYVGTIDTAKCEFGISSLFLTMQPALNALYFRYSPNEINQTELNSSNFFAISLNETDIMRVHNPTPELMPIINNNTYGIPYLWRDGIQYQTLITNYFEFKLRGNPWSATDADAVDSRKFINDLINLLARTGWSLYATCHLRKSVTDKSTFFFRTSSSIYDPSKPIVNFCVSLNDDDKIRLIDNYAIAFAEPVRTAIKCGWSRLIKSESYFHSSWEFKLNGYPFYGVGTVDAETCIMIMYLFHFIEYNGYKLLCSADVSGKYTTNNSNNKIKCDLHSLFFVNNN